MPRILLVVLSRYGVGPTLPVGFYRTMLTVLGDQPLSRHSPTRTP
jgi:hypothetical protein